MVVVGMTFRALIAWGAHFLAALLAYFQFFFLEYLFAHTTWRTKHFRPTFFKAGSAEPIDFTHYYSPRLLKIAVYRLPQQVVGLFHLIVLVLFSYPFHLRHESLNRYIIILRF
jgi:hypothetical protein